MANIIPPNALRPIVDENAMMSQVYQAWTQDITEQVEALKTLTGAGSPEGVVVADVTRYYMDSSGIAGSILYIKRDADIAGDRSLGWIRV